MKNAPWEHSGIHLNKNVLDKITLQLKSECTSWASAYTAWLELSTSLVTQNKELSEIIDDHVVL